MFRHRCLQKPPEKLPERDAVQAETRMGRKVLGWRQESELRFRRDRNMEKWGVFLVSSGKWEALWGQGREERGSKGSDPH